MDEPIITINGVACSTAEAIAIRVAVGSMMHDLVANGLGEDEHGKTMTKLYLANLDNVQRKMGLYNQQPAKAAG